MRPAYETDAHRERERQVIDAVKQKWRCDAEKLPKNLVLDYVLLRNGTPMAFAELKSKSHKSLAEVRDLGGYLCDLTKIERATNFQRISGLPFVLVVEFKDGVYAAVIKDLASLMPFDMRVRGRTDRGDWQDVSPPVLIDVARFRRKIHINTQAEEQSDG